MGRFLRLSRWAQHIQGSLNERNRSCRFREGDVMTKTKVRDGERDLKMLHCGFEDRRRNHKPMDAVDL